MNLTFEVRIKNTAASSNGPFVDLGVTQTLDIDITKEANPAELVSKILTEGVKTMADKANELFPQQ